MTSEVSKMRYEVSAFDKRISDYIQQTVSLTKDVKDLDPVLRTMQDNIDETKSKIHMNQDHLINNIAKVQTKFQADFTTMR